MVAHIKLLKIQRRIVKEIYPRKLRRGTSGVYRVNYACVMKFEAELDEWFQSIPLPSQDESNEAEILRQTKKKYSLGIRMLTLTQNTTHPSTCPRTRPNGPLSTLHNPRRSNRTLGPTRYAILCMCISMHQSSNANRMACRKPRGSWPFNECVLVHGIHYFLCGDGSLYVYY